MNKLRTGNSQKCFASVCSRSIFLKNLCFLSIYFTMEPMEVVRISYGSIALFWSILHNVFLLYYVEMFVSVYKIDKTSFWIGEVCIFLYLILKYKSLLISYIMFLF
jgi:hypothetical protein